ncbi:hypothetical protein EVAR_49220_1 [Eumeta japonica]|uniref:Uncharacterized protein n=1 Tax=Eumeta variegata TaxID=151549 RepID=A0A4C1XLY3_EUMVA|nr:hypothetical protein EVAR_49220_1 [Eumeta japonica]
MPQNQRLRSRRASYALVLANKLYHRKVFDVVNEDTTPVTLTFANKSEGRRRTYGQRIDNPTCLCTAYP